MATKHPKSEAGSVSELGPVSALARYPVKSMAGEHLTEARFGPLGVEGDRRWAVYTEDGGIGSGKTTRRFRRIDGLFDLQADLDENGTDVVPKVVLPDGSEYRADDPAADAALSAFLGQPLQLHPESSVVHHDESRVHLITTAGVRRLEQLIGEPVDVSRFRANIVIEVAGTGFVEDDWSGRTLAIGDEVRLTLGAGMPRCVMIGLPQPIAGLPAEGRLLKQLGQEHEVRFGLKTEVARGGTVRLGDVGTLL